MGAVTRGCVQWWWWRSCLRTILVRSEECARQCGPFCLQLLRIAVNYFAPAVGAFVYEYEYLYEYVYACV